jgi:hypothetical protein
MKQEIPTKTKEGKKAVGSPRQKKVNHAIVLFVITFVVSLGVCIFLVYFLGNESKATRKMRTEIASVLSQLNEVADLNKKQEAAKQTRIQIEKKLLSSSEVPTQLFPLLNALSQQYSVVLELKLGAEIIGAIEGGNSIEFEGKVMGDFAQIAKFLSAVETLDTNIQIKSWVFVPSSGKPQVNFNALLYTRE